MRLYVGEWIRIPKEVTKKIKVCRGCINPKENDFPYSYDYCPFCKRALTEEIRKAYFPARNYEHNNGVSGLEADHQYYYLLSCTNLYHSWSYEDANEIIPIGRLANISINLQLSKLHEELLAQGIDAVHEKGVIIRTEEIE